MIFYNFEDNPILVKLRLKTINITNIHDHQKYSKSIYNSTNINCDIHGFILVSSETVRNESTLMSRCDRKNPINVSSFSSSSYLTIISLLLYSQTIDPSEIFCLDIVMQSNCLVLLQGLCPRVTCLQRVPITEDNPRFFTIPTILIHSFSNYKKMYNSSSNYKKIIVA